MLENRDHSRAAVPFRLGERHLRLLHDARYREFQNRTAGYLRRAFPELVELCTDEDLYTAADLALQRAGAWGRRTEREIWQFLIPMCFLGTYFDADPQYSHMLAAADWDRGSSPKRSGMEKMRRRIDVWLPVVEKDYADISRVMDDVAAFYLSAKSRFGPTEYSFDTVGNALIALSPNRWMQVPDDAKRPWFETCNRRARELGFAGAEGIAYCLASFYFGYAFERNPLFPWAWKTLIELEGTNEERANAFAQEVSKHLLRFFEQNRKIGDSAGLHPSIETR